MAFSGRNFLWERRDEEIFLGIWFFIPHPCRVALPLVLERVGARPALDSFVSSPPYDPSTKSSSRTPAFYHVYGWSWCQKGANIMLFLVGGETTDFHILFTASKHHHSSKTCQLSKNFFSTRTLKFISGDRESSCESSLIWSWLIEYLNSY